jgi:hypothetical protein
MHWRTAVEMHWRTAYSRPHSSNRRVGTPFPADTSQRWLLDLSSRDVAVERLAAGHREAVDALKTVGCTDTA